MPDYCLKQDWRRTGELHFLGEGLHPILSLDQMALPHELHRHSSRVLSDWVRMGELRSPLDELIQDWKDKTRKHTSSG